MEYVVSQFLTQHTKMKFLFSLLFQCIVLISNAQSDYIISSTSIGPFTSKMKLVEALKTAKSKFTVKEDSIMLEGDNYLVFNLLIQEKIVLQIEPDCLDENCEVMRYWIYGNQFVTKEGLGIGNTIQDFLEVYELDQFIFGEGGTIFFRVKGLNINMMVDQSLIDEKWWTNGSNFEELPKGTKIVSMIFI